MDHLKQLTTILLGSLLVFVFELSRIKVLETFDSMCDQFHHVDNRFKEQETATVFANCEKVQPWKVNTALIFKMPVNLCTKTLATGRICRDYALFQVLIFPWASWKSAQDLIYCYQLQKLNLIYLHKWTRLLLKFCVLCVCGKIMYQHFLQKFQQNS